jgi:hypothetical protein
MAFVVSSGELATTGAGVTARVRGHVPAGSAVGVRGDLAHPAPGPYRHRVPRTEHRPARHPHLPQGQRHRPSSGSPSTRSRSCSPSPLPGMTPYRFIERLVSDVALYDNWYGIKVKLNGTAADPAGAAHADPPVRRELDPASRSTRPPAGKDFRAGRGDPHPWLLAHRPHVRRVAHRVPAGPAARVRRGVQAAPADVEVRGPSDGCPRPAGRRPGLGRARTSARFREMWRSFTDGGGAEGGTPILEDGMTYDKVGFNPEQAQYIEARKLTREEVQRRRTSSHHRSSGSSTTPRTPTSASSTPTCTRTPWVRGP